MTVILVLSIIVCQAAFFIHLPSLLKIKRGEEVRDDLCVEYSYSASTRRKRKDHNYKFTIKKKMIFYRCYIDRTPSGRGENSEYMGHYLTEPITGRRYICWTGNIINIDQAKTLCRNWADKNQVYFDTGTPAPGF